MKQKERYRPPKFGQDAGYAAIEDTGDPYQNIANAIVELAARDYMEALKFLEKYPEPPDVNKFLTKKQVSLLDTKIVSFSSMSGAELETAKRASELRRSKEYKRYKTAVYLWTNHMNRVADCELFFKGDWIQMLTGLDGVELMRMLKEEVDGSKTIFTDGQTIR